VRDPPVTCHLDLHVSGVLPEAKKMSRTLVPVLHIDPISVPMAYGSRLSLSQFGFCACEQRTDLFYSCPKCSALL
jgi:hypothetical protein